MVKRRSTMKNKNKKDSRSMRRKTARKSGGAKKVNKWSMFTKKVYEEMKRKNPHVEFKDALVEASKRKARGEY
jgi:hypothetical protein